MPLLRVLDGTASLVALGELGPWGTVGLVAFIASTAMFGGLERMFRMRVAARGRRGGPYRPDPRRPRFDVEVHWDTRSGLLWAMLSAVMVGLPLALSRWTPAWLAVVIALLAPPMAFALARACERWRDSPLSPNRLALGWVTWAAVVALFSTLERRAALGALLFGTLVGDTSAHHEGLRDVLLVALVGACSLGSALVVAEPHGDAPSRPG